MTGGSRHGVEVRAAQPGDAPELARLLAGGAGPAMAERLEAMRGRADCAVLVAAGHGGLAGLVALHWAPTLQRARPVARITALAVDADERRRGIGRLLLKAASQAARAAACDSVEIAPHAGQEAVAAFCRATGFTEGGAVFERALRKRGG